MTEIEVQEIAQKIYDKKGFNILVLDVRNVCMITDYFIIAEGNVDKHVQALSQYIVDFLLEKKIKPFHIEGKSVGDWVVLDYGDVIVHLMQPEMREKYAIEEVWKAGKIVPTPLT